MTLAELTQKFPFGADALLIFSSLFKYIAWFHEFYLSSMFMSDVYGCKYPQESFTGQGNCVALLDQRDYEKIINKTNFSSYFGNSFVLVNFIKIYCLLKLPVQRSEIQLIF